MCRGVMGNLLQRPSIAWTQPNPCMRMAMPIAEIGIELRGIEVSLRQHFFLIACIRDESPRFVNRVRSRSDDIGDHDLVIWSGPVSE